MLILKTVIKTNAERYLKRAPIFPSGNEKRNEKQ
jgi:hypothetical protein